MSKELQIKDSRVMQGQETRHHVLLEAGRLFAVKGYKATSIRDLVTVTGVAAGNILYHFKSKQGLFLATIQHFTLELGGLNKHFDPLFSADIKDRQQVADAFHHSIRSFIQACLGPQQVDGLMGLYLRVLAEGDETALKMLFQCFSSVQTQLPALFRRLKPEITDAEVAFMQQLLWSLLQYPVVSKRLILHDMKQGADYSPEYLTATAWHITYYCCLPLNLPPPSSELQLLK